MVCANEELNTLFRGALCVPLLIVTRQSDAVRSFTLCTACTVCVLLCLLLSWVHDPCRCTRGCL